MWDFLPRHEDVSKLDVPGSWPKSGYWEGQTEKFVVADCID